jgi:hypothetical protein
VIKAFCEAVEEVSEEDWTPFYREVNGKLAGTGRQWAEGCFVPNRIGLGKKGAAYRHPATREELQQPELPGMEKSDEEVSSPVMHLKERRCL